MFTVTKFLGDNNQKVENFMDKKHALSMITKYFSESKDYGWYPVFILGDSGAIKYIRAKRYDTEKIIDYIYDVYKQDKLFQKEIQEVKKGLNNQGKSVGSLGMIEDNKFGLLPFFNEEKYRNLIDEDVSEQSIKKAIKTYLEDSFNNFMLNLNDVGLLNTDNNGKYIYFNDLVKGKTDYDKKAELRKVMRDFFYNTKFATIMQMQIFTINPIFYQNGNPVDLQKRYKEIHASGNRLSIEAIDPFTNRRYSDRDYQKVVYIDDIKENTEDTNSEFMEVIKSIWGENSDVYNTYKKVSFTDGQGWRTLKSYKAIMGMAGKWNKKCEDAYNEIERIRSEIKNSDSKEATEEQIRRLSELNVVFQPIKPFLYTLERIKLGNNSIFPIPVQMKYAEITVIPELLPKGSKLRDIISWAEDADVDLIAATTTVKVGSFGSVDVKSSMSSKDLRESLANAFIHELDYKDYVIQNNVPESVQGSHLFATQGRKIIMASLEDRDSNGNTIYYDTYTNGNLVNLGDREPQRLNSYNLNRFYVSLIATNILEDFDKFKSLISDPEKVRKVLVQMTINNSRESRDNLRGYSKGRNLEEDFLMPLFEGGIEHDTAALLLSIFKKQVNKQKINGGSAVQASAFGIKDYEEKENLRFIKDPDADNILYAECEIPWDLYYTDANGNRVELQFTDWCNSDGSLKLGKVIENDNPNYKDYLSYKDKDNKVHIPLIEEKFPGILTFIALRIPTEEKYSMINLKIKSFTLKVNGGGVIKVPAQGTAIAGFDFDIDKLYFMRREYKYKSDLSNDQIADIWNKIYEENPDIKSKLQTARSKDVAVQEDISKLFSSFYQSAFAQEVAETEGIKDRLYKYWKEAELEGFPDQVFNKYLEEHAEEYLTLDEYDYSKTPWDENQSRVARNNMLITLIQRRLEDPQTLKERLTPGNFEGVIRAAEKMKNLMGIDDSKYDYSDPWTIVMYNQQNQVAGKLVGIFANQNINNAITSLMSEFSLTNPISFGEHRIGLSNLINPNAQVKQLLAAAVDAVKNPVLQFLNINTVTASSTALLSRIGYNFDEIGLLLNQPIIRDICRECLSNNIFNIDTALNNVLQRWSYKGQSGNPVFLSSEILIREITNKPNPEIQFQVAQLFQTIYKSAQEVDKFVTNTKFTASNAVKSTFGGMYAQQDKVMRYIQNFGNNDKSYISMRVSDFTDAPLSLGLHMERSMNYMREVMKNPFGYEQVMYDANVAAIKELGRYYPYSNDTYTRIRSFMSDLTGYGLDEETIDQIHEHMLRYMISNVDEQNLFNPEYPIELSDGTTMASKEFFTKYVPLMIEKYLSKYPKMKELPIFDLMVFEEDDNGNIIMKIGDVGSLNIRQKESIRDSWEVLLDNPDTNPLATILYMYSYYQSGFGFGVIGFNHLCPLEVKLNMHINDNISYIDFLNMVKKEDKKIQVDPIAFAHSFIISHRDNTRLVYTPRSTQETFIKSKIYPNGYAVDKFELDYTKEEKSVEPFIIRSTRQSIHFRPAILIDGLLYIANNGSKFNVSNTGKMTYNLVKENNSMKVTMEQAMKAVNQESESGATSFEDEYVELNDFETINDIIDEMVSLVGRKEGLDSESERLMREDIDKQVNETRSQYLKQNNSTEEALRLLKKDLIGELIEGYKKYGVKCKLNGKEIC